MVTLRKTFSKDEDRPKLTVTMGADNDVALRVEFGDESFIDIGYFDKDGVLHLYFLVSADRERLKDYFAMDSDTIQVVK